MFLDFRNGFFDLINYFNFRKINVLYIWIGRDKIYFECVIIVMFFFNFYMFKKKFFNRWILREKEYFKKYLFLVFVCVFVLVGEVERINMLINSCYILINGVIDGCMIFWEYWET